MPGLTDIYLRHAADVGARRHRLRVDQTFVARLPPPPTPFVKGDTDQWTTHSSTEPMLVTACISSQPASTRSIGPEAIHDAPRAGGPEFILVGRPSGNARFVVIDRPSLPG